MGLATTTTPTVTITLVKSNSSNINNNKIEVKKCVRFAKGEEEDDGAALISTIIEVLHREDYTEEEKLASFYTKKELHQFKKDAICIAQRLDAVNVVTDVKSIRGLEHFLLITRRAVKSVRDISHAAVFVEQKSQYREGRRHNLNWNRIARMYSDYTRSAITKAIQIAKRDEEYAEIKDNDFDHIQSSSTMKVITKEFESSGIIIKEIEKTKTTTNIDDAVLCLQPQLEFEPEPTDADTDTTATTSTFSSFLEVVTTTDTTMTRNSGCIIATMPPRFRIRNERINSKSHSCIPSTIQFFASVTA